MGINNMATVDYQPTVNCQLSLNCVIVSLMRMSNDILNIGLHIGPTCVCIAV